MNTNQDLGMKTPAAKSETLPTRQAIMDEMTRLYEIEEKCKRFLLLHGLDPACLQLE